MGKTTRRTSSHRTVNLLRGIAVVIGTEAGIGGSWEVNNSVGVPIFVACNAPASNRNSGGVQYFSVQ